jgi:hypothetical protein
MRRKHGLISLYEAAKRLGLREQSRTNWTPHLREICRRGHIPIQTDEFGVPCIDVGRLGALETEIIRYRSRPPAWPKKRPKSSHQAMDISAENPH